MAQFSRRTILASTDLMANWGHTNIDRFLLEYGLEETVRGNSMANRANALGRHLIANPDALSEDGENLADSVVGKLVESVSRGHLDQGIAAHVRGDWAAANAQFRSFIESLFDSVAEHLADGAALPPVGNQRRIWLANRNPPFFLADLNEWDGQGHGFIEAFFRRLRPAGAHPGLSDEDDSTFRLHLVLLVARNLLRRI